MDSRPFWDTSETAPAHHAGAGETLYSIQYLRAIAAYLVVIFHVTASLNSETGSGTIFRVGAIGVDVFFILSGFLMAMLVAERDCINGRFLLRRFARIAPLYYLVTLTIAGGALISQFWFQAEDTSLGHLVSSLLFVPYPRPDGSMTPILGLGWTLNYEMFFYCLVALTTWWFGDRSLRMTVIILSGMVVAGLLVDLGPVWRFYTDPIILEFAIGILIYRYVYRDRRKRNLAIFAVVFFAGLLIVALTPQNAPGSDRILDWGLPALMIATGGIFILNFKSEWLKRLGDWSYSTYLVHVFVIQLAVKSLSALGMADSTSPVILCLVVLPVTVAVSAISYHFFELRMVGLFKRMLAWKRTRAQERMVVIAPPALLPDHDDLLPSRSEQPDLGETGL